MNNQKRLNQIKVMLELQDELNCLINEDWIEAGYPWLRAAWIECAELMDYVNFKWWKKQIPNLPQAHNEASDIFHFLLSNLLVEEFISDDLDLPEKILLDMSEESINETKEIFEDLDTLEYIEALASSCLEQYPDYVTLFAIVCERLELSFDDLYKMYISKNVLNIFRQNNGYKEGTYIKQWPSMLCPDGTVEDNVYLEGFLNESATQDMFENQPEKVFDYLYNRLEADYPG